MLWAGSFESGQTQKAVHLGGKSKILILDFKFFGLHHSNPFFYFNTKTSPTLPNIQLPGPRSYICLLEQFLKKKKSLDMFLF